MRDTLRILTFNISNVLTKLKAAAGSDEQELLAKEAQHCSYGDTVHYAEHPKIFERCEGSYLYDLQGREYLDLQMWYSAVNFGYANPRLNDALKRQIDTLPQLACQYLHAEKVELAEALCSQLIRLHRQAGPPESASTFSRSSSCFRFARRRSRRSTSRPATR